MYVRRRRESIGLKQLQLRMVFLGQQPFSSILHLSFTAYFTLWLSVISVASALVSSKSFTTQCQAQVTHQCHIKNWHLASCYSWHHFSLLWSHYSYCTLWRAQECWWRHSLWFDNVFISLWFCLSCWCHWCRQGKGSFTCLSTLFDSVCWVMQCGFLYSQHNAKHLRLFSSFYWIDLALHMLFSVASAYLLFSMHTEICEQVVREAPNDDPIDMESCESVYSASAWLVTLAMAINMLIKVFQSRKDKVKWWYSCLFL